MQLTFIHTLELLGIFAFAISGVTAAINKSYDIIGLLALAFITVIGGGTLRDLLIGATLYIVGSNYNMPADLLQSIAVTVIVGIRLLSLHYNGQLPRLRN